MLHPPPIHTLTDQLYPNPTPFRSTPATGCNGNGAHRHYDSPGQAAIAPAARSCQRTITHCHRLYSSLLTHAIPSSQYHTITPLRLGPVHAGIGTRDHMLDRLVGVIHGPADAVTKLFARTEFRHIQP